MSREKRQGRREQTEERSEGAADRGTKVHESLLKGQGMVGRAGVVPGRSAWCRKSSFAEREEGRVQRDERTEREEEERWERRAERRGRREERREKRDEKREKDQMVQKGFDP